MSARLRADAFGGWEKERTQRPASGWHAQCFEACERHGVVATIEKEVKVMLNLLWGVAVLFFVLWLFGFAAFHVTNGLVHLLLVLAVAAVLIRIVMGRRIA